MGSSTTRKVNDQVRINRPLSATESAGGGASSAPVDSNTVCPVSFRVKLTDQGAKLGAKLVLVDGASIRYSESPNTKVGKLAKTDADRVSTCLGLGIKYSATVIADKKGILYAGFSQN